MFRRALVVLLLIVTLHAPWRLAALTVEEFVLAPESWRTSQRVDHYWDTIALMGRVYGLGYSVGFGRPSWQGVPVAGLTVFEDHSVVVNASMYWNDRYSTLAHEAGHILAPQRIRADAHASECFAESVSALLVGDSLREHARYLAEYKWDCLWVSLAEWPAIYHSAATLRDR